MSVFPANGAEISSAVRRILLKRIRQIRRESRARDRDIASSLLGKM